MSPRLTYLMFKNPLFFAINKLLMKVEFINNCDKKTLRFGATPLLHQMLKALLAQLDRASVF